MGMHRKTHKKNWAMYLLKEVMYLATKKKKCNFIIKEEEKNGCWRSISRVIEHMRDQFSSVAQSSLTLWSHELQHTRLPCPSPTPGASSNSRPSCQWCHPTISSSVVPFSSHLQSFPASGSFPMSWFFTSGGHSIGASASASVLPMNIQDWFPLGWTGWISLQSKGLSRVFSNTIVQKHQFFGVQLIFIVQLSHPCMTTGKTIALTRRTLYEVH